MATIQSLFDDPLEVTGGWLLGILIKFHYPCCRTAININLSQQNTK